MSDNRRVHSRLTCWTQNVSGNQNLARKLQLMEQEELWNPAPFDDMSRSHPWELHTKRRLAGLQTIQ
jgi:hypothetical protein